MCCHRGMPCRRHRIWHPTPSQYTGTGLSIGVERHTGIHNYPFQCLWANLIGKSFPDLPHIPANVQLNDAVMMVVSRKLGGKRTVPTGSWTRGVRIYDAIHSPTAASCIISYPYWSNLNWYSYHFINYYIWYTFISILVCLISLVFNLCNIEILRRMLEKYF